MSVMWLGYILVLLDLSFACPLGFLWIQIKLKLSVHDDLSGNYSLFFFKDCEFGVED